MAKDKIDILLSEVAENKSLKNITASEDPVSTPESIVPLSDQPVKPDMPVDPNVLDPVAPDETEQMQEYDVAGLLGKGIPSKTKKVKDVDTDDVIKPIDVETVDEANIRLNEENAELRKNEIDEFLSPVYFDDSGKVKFKGINASTAKSLEDSFKLLEEDQVQLLSGGLNDLLRNQSDVPFDVANFSDVIGQFAKGTKKTTLDEMEMLAAGIGREDLYLIIKDIQESKGNMVLSEGPWIRAAWETVLIDAYAAPLQQKIIRGTATATEQQNYYRAISQSLMLRNMLSDTLSSGAKIMRYSQGDSQYIKNLSLNLNERRAEIEGYFTRGEIDLKVFALMMNDLTAPQRQYFKRDLNDSITGKFLQGLGKGYKNFMDITTELYINAKLSSPLTHISNVAGTAMFNAYRIFEYGVAAGINKVFGINDADYMQWNEVMDMVYSTNDALKLGANNAKLAAVSGKPIDGLDKVDLRRTHTISRERLGAYADSPLGSIVEGLGFATRMPTNLLTAEDEFFKGAMYHMELNRMIRKEYNKARQGGATHEEADRLRRAMLAKPPKDMKIEAMKLAREGTFTGALPEGFAKDLQKYFNMPEVKMFVPFYKTIMNIFYETSSRIPGLHLLNSNTRKALKAGGPEAQLAKTKLALGTAFMTGWGMFAYGTRGPGDDWFITGAAPEGKDAKKAFYAAGFRPYSVVSRQEDGSYKSYEYKRFDPFGQLMGLAADMSYLLSRPDVDPDSPQIKELVIGAMQAASVTVTDNPLIDGANVLGAMIDFKGGDWEAWARENMRTLVGGATDFFVGTYANPMGALANTTDQIYGDSQPNYEMLMIDGEAVGWESVMMTDPDTGESFAVPKEMPFFGSTFNEMSTTSQMAWREYYKMWNKIKSQSIFFNDEAAPSLTLWGEEMKGPEQKWYSWTRVYGSQWNDIDKAMLKYGLYLSMPDKYIDGIALTPTEYNRFILDMNETRRDIFGYGKNLTLKEAMKKLVNDDRWIGLASGSAENRKKAHEEMTTLLGFYREAARNEYKANRKDWKKDKQRKELERYDPNTAITFDIGQ